MQKYKVYLLTFPSGKHYCGFTSQKLEKRWNYGKGYQKCPLVYKAILKYGWDNVEKKLIFSSDDRDEALQKEKDTIAELQLTNPDYGYNLHEGGKPNGNNIFSNKDFIEKHKQQMKELWKDPVFLKKMKKRKGPTGPKSEETKKKISDAKKGSIPVNRKAVIQLDPDTLEEIADFVSATEAAIAVCGNSNGCSNILNACKGKRKTAYKYKWRFQD